MQVAVPVSAVPGKIPSTAWLQRLMQMKQLGRPYQWLGLEADGEDKGRNDKKHGDYDLILKQNKGSESTPTFAANRRYTRVS